MTTSPSQPNPLQPGEGRKIWVLTDLVAFKALAQDTNGAYSLFETQTPARSGAPPHIQRNEDEAFFVLEGTYTFLLGDKQVEAQAGSFVFAPRGTPHAFTNSGETPARMLILASPGGNHERFFLDLGVPVDDPSVPLAVESQPDVETIIRIAHKYGIEILPPPGA